MLMERLEAKKSEIKMRSKESRIRFYDQILSLTSDNIGPMVK